VPVQIFEATDCTGGNARTVTWKEFRFDTGAHRFHDKFPAVTSDIKALLGDQLISATSPSQILYQNKFVDFPLSPLNLAAALGPRKLAQAIAQFMHARLSPNFAPRSLEEYAVQAYGRTVAEEFLLGYSEKLWGAKPAQLLPEVSGQRLKGLSLKTIFVEAVRGRRAKTRHLDGQFFYPRLGIGQLMEQLAAATGSANILLQAKITRITHRNNLALSLEVNQQQTIPCERVYSTLPLNILVNILDPKPPADILAAAKSLRFRHVLLVTLFLKRDSVTPNASLYFPDRSIPITRISEPKNRSPEMAPAGFTSLCAEIPCSIHEPLWMLSDAEAEHLVTTQLSRSGLIRNTEIIGCVVHRIPFAYPILEIGSDLAVIKILNYLSPFKNLRTFGRNAAFEYTHIHNLLETARQEIETTCNSHPDSTAVPATARATDTKA
jgi:protoporphyrinogen oxidase